MVRGRRTKAKKHDMLEEIFTQFGAEVKDEWLSSGSKTLYQTYIPHIWLTV